MDDMLYGSGGENIQSGETDSAQWRPYAESEHMTTDLGSLFVELFKSIHMGYGIIIGKCVYGIKSIYSDLYAPLAI